MNIILTLLLTVSFLSVLSQSSELPFREIPESPESYSAENVAARMIDGLGFRFYWATDELRPEDLVFRPNPEARSSRETIEHIHGLSEFLVSCIRGVPSSGVDVSAWSFTELRKAVLLNLKVASDQLKSGELTLEELVIQFEGTDNTLPFWNQINGPIADAIWHCGQIVTFRRSSGNPFTSNVSLLSGKVRD